ncbi:MAG: HAMP domain-containing histidine kinase [Lachnospiraceae bacterium]|nr:HAMP domain-containing histidine kinase [Lachnospiraceae bacterium]
MSKFKKVAILVILLEIIFSVAFNLLWKDYYKSSEEGLYKVEISRAAADLSETVSEGTSKSPLAETLVADLIDKSEYKYIKNITPFDAKKSYKNEYQVKDINGILYCFEYQVDNSGRLRGAINLLLLIVMVFTLGLFLYLDNKLITPFNKMNDMTLELAKGNLSRPIKQEKSRYFKSFLWGMDMLREKLEDDKNREYELLKDRKTLILSLSHDIKTPLSAIELYAKALSKNLYDDPVKEKEALAAIERNVADIKKYVGQIADASREDFLALQVENKEVYLKDVVGEIQKYYKEKLLLNHTDFLVGDFTDCLIYADKDRLVEVMQNIIENAIKYGDGQKISIDIGQEEDCKLITISNTGSNIKSEEMVSIFDSFYRASNSENIPGNGLGLYICKELMHKMQGDIFAKSNDNIFSVTIVIRKM